MSKKLITLIGAGPVGCLTAIHLARRGFDVEIFERRPDIRNTKIHAGRSINLALSLRGISALQELGIEKEILNQAVPMYGRVMHSPKKELVFQRYGLDDSQFINSISRAELNKALLSFSEKIKGIRIHFEHRLESYDVPTKTLHFYNEKTQDKKTLVAATVIGCDGSASALRTSMQSLADFSQTEDLLSYGYKEFTVPAGLGGAFQMEKNALHIWPRGSHMLIALPNFEGSFTCTLFLPWKGAESFESLENARSAREFFNKHFPDALEKIEDLETSFFSNPTGQMITVKAGPWVYRDHLLLLGDAAHAIVPFFGQGLNCGFEDTTILGSLLDKNKNLGEVFEIFYRQRKKDADAIADLALDNFVEMRDKVSQPRFLLEKAIEKKLMEKFPHLYVSRYSLVTFSRQPYSFALKVGKIQDVILNRLSEGLSRAEDVDMALAAKLISQELGQINLGVV